MKKYGALKIQFNKKNFNITEVKKKIHFYLCEDFGTYTPVLLIKIKVWIYQSAKNRYYGKFTSLKMYLMEILDTMGILSA